MFVRGKFVGENVMVRVIYDFRFDLMDFVHFIACQAFGQV